MAMKLENYTLTHYPSSFTIPRAQRSNSFVETLESVEHFTWGFFLIGKIIEVNWTYMPSAQFDSLDAVFQGDAEVTWDPGITGETTVYNVQIIDFSGEYHEAVGSDTEIWRQNCQMKLLIMSVESES